jgi:hypothetical protein
MINKLIIVYKKIKNLDFEILCFRFISHIIKKIGPQIIFFEGYKELQSKMADDPRYYEAFFDEHRIKEKRIREILEISAVFRVKNVEATIFQSLLSFSRICSELIVVDNNSKDETLRQIELFIRRYPDVNIRIFHYQHEISRYGAGYKDRLQQNPDSSISNYYNFAFEQATGRYVLKADAGCLVIPTSIGHLCDCLLSEPDVVLTKGIELNGKFIASEPRLYKRNIAKYMDGDLYEYLCLAPNNGLKTTQLQFPMFIHCRNV